MPELRLLIKDQFMKYSHVADPRAVDRLVAQVNFRMNLIHYFNFSGGTRLDGHKEGLL